MRNFLFSRSVLVVVGLTCVICPTALVVERTALAAGRAESVEKVTFTPVVWEANFRRALHAPWARSSFVALSPTPPTRLLLCVDQGDHALYLWREREMRKLGKAGKSGGGGELPPIPKELTNTLPNMDLWLADPDGSHARILHHFQGDWLKSAAWSPDGQAVLAQLVPYLPDKRPHPTQIQVLDLKSENSYRVADHDEEMPSWGVNSKSLFFWRKMADAVVTPEGNITAYARWQLLRVEAPWEKPEVRLATPTVLSEPTLLSPGGARLLSIPLFRDPGDGMFRYGPPAWESLATGQVQPLLPDGPPLPERHPDDIAFPYPAPCWSGDSRWMFHTASQRFGGMNNVLYDLKNSRHIDLNPLLNTWAETALNRTSEERLRILSAAWIHPDDNRLLLEIGTFVFHGDFGSFPLNSPPPKHAWVVYDPAANKLLSVEGLPKAHGTLPGGGLYRVGTHYCQIGISRSLATSW